MSRRRPFTLRALAVLLPLHPALAAAEQPSAPAVAVLVADQGPLSPRPVPWWAPGKGLPYPTRNGDAAVAAVLGGAVRLVDATGQARRLSALRVGAAPLPAARAREVARLLGADVLVHGAAMAADEEEAAGVLEQAWSRKHATTGRPCSVTLALRAHRADTGEAIATAAGVGRSTALRAEDCVRSASAKAAREAAPELRGRVLAYWRARSGA